MEPWLLILEIKLYRCCFLLYDGILDLSSCRSKEYLQCGRSSEAGGGGWFGFHRPCLFPHISHRGDILKPRPARLLHLLFPLSVKRRGIGVWGCGRVGVSEIYANGSPEEIRILWVWNVVLPT